MKGLTKRQLEILDFIQNFIQNNKYSPSYREIKDYFKFSSLGSVYKHLNVLKRKGALQAEKQCSRSLSIPQNINPQTQVGVKISFIGDISLEDSIELFPDPQVLAVPSNYVLNPENTYILRTKGFGLYHEMILDGDLLIVEAIPNAFSGDLIIAFVDQEIIIKRFYPDGEYARLLSYSGQEEARTVRISDLHIQGIVTGLFRQYRQ